MDRHKLEAYRKRLVREREDLLGLVTRVEKDGRIADEEGTQDLADKAANSYTKEFLFHQSSSERSLLQEIEQALSRIESGAFGECLQCGGEIEKKRLEAVPWARHCIPCQEAHDQESNGASSGR
jgi:RNA polymerase-binding transcription factor